MDKRIHQALEILNKEMEKDKKEVQNHKNQMINEIKGLKKEELFKKNKVTLVDKIMKIFGHGKKR
mgnify:CR=1 FL=1|jgi:hypothetical protein